MPAMAMYDTVANQYASANIFGSITKSHQNAMSQIEQSAIGHKPQLKILDLGVGDGAFMRKVNQLFPIAELTGIDISTEMLKLAKSNLSITTIEASAAEATNYLPHYSQDLVIAHFVNAYIPIQILFQQAQMLTRSNGFFSVITSTYESFPTAQQHLADFISRDSFMSSIVGHYYKSVVKNTTIAANQDQLLKSLNRHNFEVEDHQRIKIPITFHDMDELIAFGIEGGWFLNSLNIKLIPRNFLLNRIKHLLDKFFTFPCHDTQIIDVVFAKK